MSATRLARALRRSDGVTLLETTIALAILAFGLLGIMGMQLHSMQSGSRGRHLSDATSYARDRLEQLHRLDFDDPALTDTAAAWTADVARNTVIVGPVNVNEETYQVAERITDVNADLKRIDVRVRWNDPDRPNRTVILTSARLRD